MPFFTAKNRLLITIIILFFSIFVFASFASNTDELTRKQQLIAKFKLMQHKKIIKIFIINSYREGHSCTQPQIEGFRNYLASIERLSEGKIEFDIQGIDLRTKTQNITPEQQQKAAIEAIDEVYKFKPDIIYTTDDNAFRLCALPLSQKYKVIFTGINIPLSYYYKKYGIKSNRCKILGDNMTIVYPKNSLYQILDTRYNPYNANPCNLSGLEEITMLDQFFVLLDNAKIIPEKVYIISSPPNKTSTTGYFLYKNYLREFHNKIEHSTFYIETFYDLQKVLNKINKMPFGIIVPIAQRIYNTKTKKYLPKTFIINYIIKHNKKHIELGNCIFCKFGQAIGCSPSFYLMGKDVARLMTNYLFFNKWMPGSQRSTNILEVNIKHLQELKLDRILQLNKSLIKYKYTDIDIPQMYN